MPRDLTDLMEHATSFAPPEPHRAEDITRLAAHRHRRRTTSVAAGLAVAVVLAGAVGYGVTRDHDRTPEPAAPYKHGQELTIADTVSAESMPGYRSVPWKIPSIERLTDKRLAPWHTYLDIDADGRLLVETVPPGDPEGETTVKVYDAPGATPTEARQPPPPGENLGEPVQWFPTMSDDSRLIWRPIVQASVKSDGYHVTDLSGGGDVFIHATALGPIGYGLSQVWVSGDRLWFLTVQRADNQGGIYYNLHTASLTHPADQTLVARQVVLADVRNGVAGWMAKDGNVFTENAQGGSAREVHVPYAPDCRMPQAAVLDVTSAFVVGPSSIALSERCRAGQKDEANELLAFDTSGQLLMHLSSVSVFSLSMGNGSLTFGGVPVSDGRFRLLHYDLRTGVLSSLPYSGTKSPEVAPQTAGDYLLWYDRAGGHEARLTG